MPNRLADATSPYLRQHAENPVDWLPWGEEAFAKAKAEAKPVFLSVGYSSCHWCHVMAHESFEDVEVAEKLNAGFVCVKVDREERPDVDEAYMAYVQMTTGRGGWPMSVFITPDGKPFYGGTYWPKEDRGQSPGFLRILDSLADVWGRQRAEVETEANRIGEELIRYFAAGSPITVAILEPALYSAALHAQVESFDPEQGGFGRSPKFPPHTAIELLLDLALSEFAKDEERQAALAMSFLTLEKMCLGGIHDHVGGGFHRYSTDAEWLLPHFEKMLYDNALMLGNLARASAIASEVDPRRAPLFARTAGGIVTWVVREMTGPDGLFYSALDADSEGEEGAFYVWDYEDLSANVAEAFGARPGGNFEDEATRQATGKNILHLREDVGGTLDDELDQLLTRRNGRERPGLDDKAIVGWNGLMIGSLAEAGLYEPAAKAAEALLDAESRHGKLPHTIVKGTPQGEAFLEDIAALADGLFKLGGLADALGLPASWTAEAARLAVLMIRDFEDSDTGAFFSTSVNHEFLFGRTRPAFDQPIPSGNALALRVLIEAGDEDRAGRLVKAVLGLMERAPSATEGLYAAALPLVAADSAPVVAAPPPIPLVVPVPFLLSKEQKADAAGQATFTVVLDLPDGLHVNGPEPPARWLAPTRVAVRPLKAEISYPPEDGIGFVGRVEISFSVTLPPDESGADLEITVAFQPCTDQECLTPIEKTLSAVLYR
jgi:uncharacterized protein YyaL (SSP411 family)